MQIIEAHKYLNVCHEMPPVIIPVLKSTQTLKRDHLFVNHV